MLAILFALLFTSAVPDLGHDTPLGSRVCGGTFEGVILAATATDEAITAWFSAPPQAWLFPCQPCTFWTPSVANVLEVEALLPSFVERNASTSPWRLRRPLESYVRQYKGVALCDRRIIAIEFFHVSTDLVTSGQWLSVETSVMGGGDLYLSARYDVSRHSLIDYSVNAPE